MYEFPSLISISSFHHKLDSIIHFHPSACPPVHFRMLENATRDRHRTEYVGTRRRADVGGGEARQGEVATERKRDQGERQKRSN